MKTTLAAIAALAITVSSPAFAQCDNQRMSGSAAVGVFTYQWDDALDGVALRDTNPIQGDFPALEGCGGPSFEVADMIRLWSADTVVLVMVVDAAPLRVAEIGRGVRVQGLQ